ncbi:hypothetical protein [Burkholderia sp. Z1]|uniref:hypothetical protein n=1 Tax=Burkholderia sp. Z1 TaxID=2759039 RepID=UPI001D00A59A|nr:hypothetical protein [Burkholderia sp. Z1]
MNAELFAPVVDRTIVLPDKTQRREEGIEKGISTQQRSAGRMGGNPNDPLTTTNSNKELKMADANSNSRPKKRKPRKPSTVLQMILRSTPDKPKRGWPYLPWMSVVDAHFKLFGFQPGDLVYLEINHITRQICIRPDHAGLALREQPDHQPGGRNPFAL